MRSIFRGSSVSTALAAVTLTLLLSGVAHAASPVITSTLTASGTAGLPFTVYTITATNTPTSFNAVGLPTGLTVNSPTPGDISGTTNQVGTFNVTISATNADGTDSKILVITINASMPVITSSPLVSNGTVGLGLTYTITTTGIPAPTITAVPLPPGLALSSGVISGVPTQSGTTFVTLQATNTAGTDTKTLQINITAPPIVSSSLVVSGAVGQAFSYQITSTESPVAGGYCGATVTSGASMNTITSTALINFPDLTGLEVVITQGATLNQRRTITAFNPATGTLTVGAAFLANVVVNDRFAVLPTNININTSTGIITGTPAAAGTFRIPITAHNTVNGVSSPCVFNNTVGRGTASLILAISATAGAPALTSSLSAVATETVPFVYGITASNGATSYSVDPASVDPLPPGLNLDGATGIISGAPNLLAPAAPRTFNVRLRATNATGTGSAVVAITVNLAIPKITSSLVPVVAITTQPFSYQATATIFTDPSVGPNQFTINPADLPLPVTTGNYSQDINTGLLSGTAAPGVPPGGDVGSYDVRLQVTNLRGTSESTLTIQVVDQLVQGAAPIIITSPSQAVAIVGCTFSYQIVATGANCYTSTALPPHMVLNTSTGLISGTPQTGDDAMSPFTVTIRAGLLDSFGACAVANTKVLTITVLPAPPLPAPPIIPSPLTTGTTVGVPLTYDITTTPLITNPTTPIPLFFSANPLPTGVSLNPNQVKVFGDTTGSLSGTPTQLGTTAVRITTVNSAGTDTKEIPITVAPVAITSTLSAAGNVGVLFPTYRILATGNCNAFTAMNLPPGLTLNTLTGNITGTPTDTGSAGPTLFPVPISASNGFGTANATLNITINGRPAGSPNITSSLAQINVIFGSVFPPYTITANPAATSFGAAGLPGNLVVDPVSGVISGTANQIGLFNVIITATNGSGSDGEILPINITPQPPVITSVNSVTGTVGQPFNFPITTTGSQPITFTVSGPPNDLPAGLSLVGNVIIGTPTVAGQKVVTITASNGGGSTQQSLTITILQTPVITSPLTFTGTIGDASFNYPITATGSATITFSVNPLPGAPGFPPGLTFANGVISGTPATAGVFSITLTATNSATPGTDTRTLLLTINPMVFTSPLVLSGVVNTAVNFPIQATGNPIAFTAPGLPANLSLNAASGLITGTPAAAGTTIVPITASNASSSVSANLTVAISSVAGGPAITSPLVQTGAVGVALTYAITATNTPTSFSAANLPAGLVLDTATGIISGTPTTAGSTNATITATNAAGSGSATLIFAISSVLGGPAITSRLTDSVLEGQAYSYTIMASNPPITSYGASGLPPMLGYSTVTGVISGTPTVPGVYTIRLTATNSNGQGQADLVLTVIAGRPIITSPLMVSGPIGAQFDYPITATGVTPITFTVTPLASLPPGVSFAGSVITGIPTMEGSFTVQLMATNALGSDGPRTLVINIGPAPARITSPLAASGALKTPFTYIITASGSTVAPAGPIVFNATNLPPGLAFSVNTISGTPLAVGVFSVTISAANNLNPGGDIKTLVITIGDQDTDGDGILNVNDDDDDNDNFPDDFEIALGSDPLSAASTPKGLAAGPRRVANIQSMTIKLNFKSAGKDSIVVKGTLDLADGQTAEGKELIVFVGGVLRTFNISNNSGKSGSDKIRLSKSNGFTITLKGSFATTFSDEGLTQETVKNASRTVNVVLFFDSTVSQSTKLLSYTATAGKGGTAKQINP